MTRPLAGSVSAIGITPESTYLTVPVTSTQIGVATTNPARFGNVLPGGGIIPTPKTQKPSVIDANYVPTQHFHLANEYKGGFSGFIDPEVMYYPMRAHFGRAVQTTAQAATTLLSAAYKHVFTPVRKTATCVIEEKFEDGDYGRVTAGCVFDRMSFTLGDVLGYEFGVTGHAQVPNTYDSAGVKTDYDFTSSAANLPSRMGGASTKTTTSPSFVDIAQGNQGNGALAFAGQAYGAESGFGATILTINGSSFTNHKFLEGSKIDSVRTLVSNPVGGSGRDPEALVCTQGMVTGTLNFTFEASDLVLAALGHKKLAVNVKYIGSQIGTSGIYYAIEFYIPNARVNSAPVRVSDTMLMVSLEFDAIYDASAGQDFKVSIWNSLTAAALGDVAGTYSGSMGGITVS